MTSGRERDSLGQLYDELRKFAPSEAADEMSQLAARLSEIKQQSGDEAEGTIDLSATWERVESYLADHPHGSADDVDRGMLDD